MSNNLSPTVIIQVYEIPGIENYVLIMINEYQNYEAVRIGKNKNLLTMYLTCGNCIAIISKLWITWRGEGCPKWRGIKYKISTNAWSDPPPLNDFSPTPVTKAHED